jgi:hypothetical protein
MSCFWVLKFYDAPVEGIGPATGEQAVYDLNVYDLKWFPDPRALFKKVVRGADGPIIEEYREDYGKWTALKRTVSCLFSIRSGKRAAPMNAGLKSFPAW